MAYSHQGEEQAIRNAVGSGNDGVFLDLGAYEGLYKSNTLALVEAGWTGVLVEPSAKPFMQLLTRHGDNPKISLVQALVGVEQVALVPFWDSNGDALSTTEKGNYERWKDCGDHFRLCYVPQITVEDLVDAFPHLQNVDVASIDTEGTSVDLFEGWPFSICTPRVFCVEIDGDPQRLEDLGMQRDYRVVYRNGENMVMVHG